MLQLLLAIALITLSIFIHELGHFLAARWRGLVVPRFSIFGIGKPMFSWHWRGVEYCICWLPIGAYVMVPQLADLGDFEGEVPEAAKQLPPAGYFSKVAVAAAGPLANILLALGLACVIWWIGIEFPVEYNRTEIGEIAPEFTNSAGQKVIGPAKAAGLRTGDIIRQIDGQPVANFQDVFTAVLFGSQVAPDGRRVAQITIEREGQPQTITVYPELVGTEGIRTIGIAPKTDLLVDKVAPDSAAAAAGIQPGDRIQSVDGKVLTRRDELREHFQKKNQTPSTLVLNRQGAERTVSLTPPNGDVLLERQYRHPMQRVMLELPAGKLDPNEDPWHCAPRELEEETGYTAREWARAGLLHNAMAYSTEGIDIFFARGLRAGAQRLDDGEFIETVQLSPAALDAACARGEVTDAKTLIGLLWLQRWQCGAWPLEWRDVGG